jgi:hypothetical protein
MWNVSRAWISGVTQCQLLKSCSQWEICGVGVCTIFAHLEVKFAEAAEEDLHALVHVDGSALILVVHHEL